MAPKIGQRWLYQNKDKIDRFICEILPDERYIIDGILILIKNVEEFLLN